MNRLAAHFECDLDRLPQSYLSRQSDFPLVADLDGDGCDEWFAPTYVPGRRWSHPMTPPYGMVMVHRSIDGQSIWNEPFYLPSMDGMIERAVVVSDQDRDGWKDLLLGSRFQGGGVRGGAACFVDLVSGKPASVSGTAKCELSPAESRSDRMSWLI